MLGVRCVAFLAISTLLLGAVQLSGERQQESVSADVPTDQVPNGISVGRPKVFDNRALTLMLENLSNTLKRIETIDQKTVAGALGNGRRFSTCKSRTIARPLRSCDLPRLKIAKHPYVK